MEDLSADFNRADRGVTMHANKLPTMVASDQAHNQKTSSARWIAIGVGILLVSLMVFSWAAVAVFHRVYANIGTWQSRWTTREMSGAADLPSIKKDLYGTLAGLKIVEVTPNSPAAAAGLVYGDIIVAYNKRPVSSDDEMLAVMAHAESQHQAGKGGTAELSLYRDGDMTIKTLMVPTGRLGIYTREWTFAGAFVEDAIMERNDYAAAEKYAAQAAEETGHYTADQLLHMRMLCVNNEIDGEDVRRRHVDQLYRNYSAEKVTLFGNYDLLYNKRYRAAAAIFERYLHLKKIDVSSELNLASCYTEMNRYDDADALITKVLARPAGDENAPSAYGLSVLSNIRGRIHMGRRQYDRAQERFLTALEHYPDDPYYALAFLYCAVQRDAKGEKPGEFELAYKTVIGRSRAVEALMAYHLDALRAFLLVKKNRTQEAGALVWKWKNSPDAKRYIPIFWARFPEGSNIIDNWNNLLKG
jgi:tetratricopeptide (TPR) repeat protein